MALILPLCCLSYREKHSLYSAYEIPKSVTHVPSVQCVMIFSVPSSQQPGEVTSFSLFYRGENRDSASSCNLLVVSKAPGCSSHHPDPGFHSLNILGVTLEYKEKLPSSPLGASEPPRKGSHIQACWGELLTEGASSPEPTIRCHLYIWVRGSLVGSRALESLGLPPLAPRPWFVG